MKLGTEDSKKLAVASVLGVGAIAAAVYLYSSLFSGGTPSPAPVTGQVAAVTTPTTVPRKTPAGVVTGPPGNVAGSPAEKVGTASTQLDPSLHMEAMLVTESVIYSGSGRNIFSAEAPILTASIPKPIAPARTDPQPPQPPAYTGPPPPPPIDLKFFGTATSAAGTRQAFLLHGEDVFLASPGDIVQRRYKVVNISASSILVEDMPNNNRQTLQLQAN